VIRLIDIQKSYDNGTKALKGVNLRIDDGEFVFLVGPSGSGKSTILKLITAEIAPTGGRLQSEQHPAPAGALHAAHPGGYFPGFPAH
jgi:ABC-type ATPase involved in cell division